MKMKLSQLILIGTVIASIVAINIVLGMHHRRIVNMEEAMVVDIKLNDAILIYNENVVKYNNTTKPPELKLLQKD